MKKLILSLLTALFALPALAEGPFIGKVTQTDAGPDGFVVVLNSGIAVMCTGGPGFAVLNKNDPNYKTFVSALTMAKSSGAETHLYTWNSAGLCMITYVSIH